MEPKYRGHPEEFLSFNSAPGSSRLLTACLCDTGFPACFSSSFEATQLEEVRQEVGCDPESYIRLDCSARVLIRSHGVETLLCGSRHKHSHPTFKCRGRTGLQGLPGLSEALKEGHMSKSTGRPKASFSAPGLSSFPGAVGD